MNGGAGAPTPDADRRREMASHRVHCETLHRNDPEASRRFEARALAARRADRRQDRSVRAEEVPPVLAALSDRWRPLFATALYTGLRKGELIGLRKADVDLPNRLLAVSHSYRRDTTKGGHADVTPIATELVPYLENAIARCRMKVWPSGQVRPIRFHQPHHETAS